MNPFVRRSHLQISVLNQEEVLSSWKHKADAIVLDITDGAGLAARQQARELVRGSIAPASKGGGEVLVRISKEALFADVKAALWPGVKGIICPSLETAADVRELDEALLEAEKEHGIPRGSTEVLVLLDSGKGIWNVREIIAASSRLSTVGLEESSLYRHMEIMPDASFDPLVYAKGRIIVEAVAAKVHPIGVAHPYGIMPGFDNPQEIHRLALRGKNMGFKGAICLHPSWVEPCNRAYAPAADQIDYFKTVRATFAEAVARGTAATPYPGTTQMIDVPVDERARIMLELWEMVQSREADKASALSKAAE
ncbi:MAG: hypothetical protein HYU30_05825 [Chloroflexi bacterium]|nr:hypothetical protein [Chloroflexota bacterium]